MSKDAKKAEAVTVAPTTKKASSSKTKRQSVPLNSAHEVRSLAVANGLLMLVTDGLSADEGAQLVKRATFDDDGMLEPDSMFNIAPITRALNEDGTPVLSPERVPNSLRKAIERGADSVQDTVLDVLDNYEAERIRRGSRR